MILAARAQCLDGDDGNAGPKFLYAPRHMGYKPHVLMNATVKYRHGSEKTMRMPLWVCTATSMSEHGFEILGGTMPRFAPVT